MTTPKQGNSVSVDFSQSRAPIGAMYYGGNFNVNIVSICVLMIQDGFQHNAFKHSYPKCSDKLTDRPAETVVPV